MFVYAGHILLDLIKLWDCRKSFHRQNLMKILFQYSSLFFFGLLWHIWDYHSPSLNLFFVCFYFFCVFYLLYLNHPVQHHRTDSFLYIHFLRTHFHIDPTSVLGRYSYLQCRVHSVRVKFWWKIMQFRQKSSSHWK